MTFFYFWKFLGSKFSSSIYVPNITHLVPSLFLLFLIYFFFKFFNYLFSFLLERSGSLFWANFFLEFHIFSLIKIFSYLFSSKKRINKVFSFRSVFQTEILQNSLDWDSFQFLFYCLISISSFLIKTLYLNAQKKGYIVEKTSVHNFHWAIFRPVLSIIFYFLLADITDWHGDQLEGCEHQFFLHFFLLQLSLLLILLLSEVKTVQFYLLITYNSNCSSKFRGLKLVLEISAMRISTFCCGTSCIPVIGLFKVDLSSSVLVKKLVWYPSNNSWNLSSGYIRPDTQ